MADRPTVVTPWPPAPPRLARPACLACELTRQTVDQLLARLEAAERLVAELGDWKRSHGGRG